MKAYTLFLITVLAGSAASNETYELYHYNGNSKIGESILNDIARHSSILTKPVKYKDFYNEMLQHNGTYSISGIVLSYQINQLIEIIHNNELETILKNLLAEIKEVPWNQPVTLYNIGFSKYLCSSDEQNPINPEYYKVYMSSSLSENCYWQFNVEVTGRYFTIQNQDNRRYLFAAANQFDMDAERRTIYTIEEPSRIVYNSDKWQLEPIRGTAQHNTIQYRIKNYFWDEYIYNFNDNLYDREVLAWKPFGCDGISCYWNVSPIM